MTHKERFQKLGVRPPKGVLLYGPPGTGKTLMARACAAQTNATFLKLAGPQLVQVWQFIYSLSMTNDSTITCLYQLIISLLHVRNIFLPSFVPPWCKWSLLWIIIKKKNNKIVQNFIKNISMNFLFFITWTMHTTYTNSTGFALLMHTIKLLWNSSN